MNGIQNHSEKLKMQLRKIEYPDKITFDILSEQNPIIFLKIIHYILIDYSSDFYKSLLEKNYELYTKNDLRFIEQVFKLAQKELNYKASLNISQFLSEQFLEQKIIFVNDMIDEVLKRHSKKFEYKKQSKGQDQNQNTKSMISGKENTDNNYQQNPLQPMKQSCQMKNQEYQFQSEEDEELCQPVQRPQPYQFSNCKVPNLQQQEIEENQSNCEINTPFILPNDSPQITQNFNNKAQIIQSEGRVTSQSTKQVVTHEDLQKLMQVILMSNENIKQVMVKFTELQTTVNMALSNFNDRLQNVENHLKIHNL